MDWTSEPWITVRKMVLRDRRAEAVQLLEKSGYPDAEAQVQAVEARIKQQQDADRQAFIDHARQRGLVNAPR